MNAEEYVQALIPPPNLDKPKFTAWVKANIQYGIDTQTVLNNIATSISIRNGVGKQLDLIGDILGLSRILNFQPQGGQSPVMTDEIYQIALQAKILQNRWDGTKQQIYDFWNAYFPLYPILIQDNQDMTMNVLVLGVPTDNTVQIFFAWDKNTSNQKGWDQGYWISFVGTLFQDIVQHGYFVPKPAGVKVTYSFPTGKIFAWDTNNSSLAGWNTGSWASI